LWSLMAKLPLSLWFVVCGLFFTALAVGCGDLESSVSNLTVTPSSATVGINQSQSFSAAGTDAYGIAVIVSPTWSVTGGVGSVSSTGLFTAGASAGSGTVVATYGDVSASSAVTITERCWVKGRLTGEFANGILVSLRGTSYSDSADSSGDYSISDVPAGTYEVYTADTGYYESSSVEVTLISGETKSAVNFVLVSKYTTTTNPSSPDLGI